MMITKKDYENAKKQFDSMLVNALVNIECYNASIEAIDKKIAEFPEEQIKKLEDEQVKAEIKEDLKEVI